MKKDVFRNFAKFTGKYLCQRFFLTGFIKFLRTPILQNTSGQLFLIYLKILILPLLLAISNISKSHQPR